MERQAKKLENEINAAVDASLIAPEKVRTRYFEKIETLETQKADIEMNLATLKIAANHRYTKEQIIAWLKMFCKGDYLSLEFQRRIIDVLVNSVYVYDDKIVIYYNVKDGKQVSFIEVCNDMEGLDPVNSADNSGNRDIDKVRISGTMPRHKSRSIKGFERLLFLL